MCRIVGYLGPERSVEEVLVTPPHALVAQSRHPRELPPDVLNADGYGYAFYDLHAPAAGARPTEPGVYRSILPMWGDDNLRSLTGHLRSGCIVASTRSATNAMPTAISNTAPYVHGALSFVHNGVVEAFHERLMRQVRDSLADEDCARIRGNTDTEHLFALLVHHLAGRSGAAALEDALSTMMKRMSGWLREAGLGAQLNVLVGDGSTLVASRLAVSGSKGEEAPSLYALSRGPGHACIASEPYDDDQGWSRVPPSTLLVVDTTSRLKSVPFSA